MKIAYVLDRPELCGGVKVVFQHAQLLLGRGHGVTVLGRGAKPDWAAFNGEYVNYERVVPHLPRQDLVIATYWTTIPVAEEFGLGPVVHFCQGYEGDLAHLAAVKPQIEAVYQRRMPALVVAPHLAEFLGQRFGREAQVVPPPLDPRFKPALRLAPRRRPWVMIPGIFEAEVKGVATALNAVRQLRAWGWPCRVVRVSILPLSQAEAELLRPERYLCQVAPETVARTLGACDLLLFPSLAMEGFGLPLLEAMAAKVPAVASDIPSTRFIGQGAIALVPPKDALAFAEAARQLLDEPIQWRRARRAGRRAAQRFHPQAVAKQLTEAVEWALHKIEAMS